MPESRRIACCIGNLQRFGYGALLQELKETHRITLDRCQSQCVGCRMQAAFMVDGVWVAFDDPGQLKVYMEESDSDRTEGRDGGA